MAIIRESLGDNRGNYHLSTKQAKWKAIAQQFKPGQNKDHVTPMEIDAAKFPHDPKKNEEIDQLHKEGRCFGCKKLGHSRRDCPTNPPNREKGKPPPYQPKACSTNVPEPSSMEQSEAPAETGPQGVKQLARSILSLDEETTNDLFTQILEGEDF